MVTVAVLSIDTSAVLQLLDLVPELDVVMARRKMSLNELSERVGITLSNLSILKTGKAKAIRFSTLDAICRVLECSPGEILEFRNDVSYARP